MNSIEQNYLKSIKLLGEQIKQAYYEAKAVKLPQSYKQVNKIVVGGMGGSQLGVDVIKHLFGDQISVPIIQVRGYDLPKFVDNKTLIILISYSGTTEEVLSIISKFKIRNFKQFQNSKSEILNNKFIIITSGGKLAEMAKKGNIPAYIFKPINNPSGQPRMGTGYTIGALLAFLKKLGVINVGDSQIVSMTKIRNSEFGIRKFSQKLKNKIPVIVSSEFLQGNAHLMANQINESSKQLALYYSIPELNHHLLEGLTFPKENKKVLHFLFLYSKNYCPKNRKRHQVTQQVLAKQRIPFSQIEFSGDKISQVMQLLTFGSYLSYELSKLNNVDPNKIPWVNFFKSRLRG